MDGRCAILCNNYAHYETSIEWGNLFEVLYLLIYPVEEAAVGVGCHHVDPVDVHDGMTEVASVQRS